jgi:hypothetical protein
MHGSGIPIWFFIGVLLLIYGGMIFGYGIYEWQADQAAHARMVGRCAGLAGPVLCSKVSTRARGQVGYSASFIDKVMPRKRLSEREQRKWQRKKQ